MAGISMKFNKIDKIVRKNGFVRVRQTGDHVIYKRNPGETVVIPYVFCNELILERYFKKYEIKY